MIYSADMTDRDLLGDRLDERLWPSRYRPWQKRVPAIHRPPLPHLKTAFTSYGRYGMMQRAIVKAHYTTPRSLKNHLAYIQREGVGLDGKKPVLFTDEGRNLQTQEIEGEKRVFRLILSPEHGDRIEAKHGMQQFTKDFMKELERETARDLRWCAAIHHNTDSPHAHIVIRGKDAHGNEVRFDAAIFKTRAREIAQERATKELGYRTPEEIRDQLKREVVSNRLTSIDRAILLRVDHLGNIIPLTPLQQARIEYLTTIDLAQKTGNSLYLLKPGWSNTLKENGKKEDIIKSIYSEQPAHIRNQFGLDCMSHLPFLYYYSKKRTVRGTIVASGLSDEMSQKPYVVIESRRPGDPPARSYCYYTSQTLKLSQLTPGQEIMLEHGRARLGEALKKSVAHEWLWGPSSSIVTDKSASHQLDLQTQVSRRNKANVLKLIRDSLSVKGQDQWNRNKTDTKPLFFYRNDLAVAGRIVASGYVDKEKSSKYILLETKLGKLYYYSSPTLRGESLSVGSEITLARGGRLVVKGAPELRAQSERKKLDSRAIHL
jgi:hypothetical protein